jgi:hypothetical protein
VIDLVRAHMIPAALSVLPAAMTSPAAIRLLLAIGWQESRFLHRAQLGGPARGFWQFEQAGGVRGVLGHEQTRVIVRDAMAALSYRHPLTPWDCYTTIQHNDVAAAVFARLLLWTDPWPLPDDEGEAWKLYLRTWRPGKPHEATWAEAWRRAA